MNLKLVVASMSVLGLVSCPVFAATHAKHKKMKHQTVAQRDYKDMGTFKDAPVCSVSQTSMIMSGMNQNVGRSMPNPCNPGWYNRIAMAGGVNIDIGKWGNRNANYMGENYKHLSINDAYFNVAASISDWVKAFASVSYMTATTNANPGTFNSFGLSEYSAAYSNNIAGTANNTVQLEQGYATIANFDVSPVFLEIGKHFQNFSSYEIHPITASLTQTMSEVLTTSAELGFVSDGFNGSVYVFDDPISKAGDSSTPTNYGVSLGYSHPNDQLGYAVGVGYLYNLIGANDTAYSIVNLRQDFATGSGTYAQRASGLALFGDVNSGPFTVGVRYTTALQRFSVNDLPKNGIADFTPASVVSGAGSVAPTAGASGAKPWAAGINAGYNFDAWGKGQNVYVGYQASREAAGLNLPRSRWLVGYGVDMFHGASFGIEWDHDNAYKAADGGNGNNTDLVSLRSSVKFG
jgi:hypothetical protein